MAARVGARHEGAAGPAGAAGAAGAEGAERGGASGAAPEELARLGDAIAEALSAIAAATAQVLAWVARFDRDGGWHAQGALSCAHWLAWRCGMSLVTAREKVRTARALEGLPLTSAAFTRGELSYCKVRSITRVAGPTTEAALLSYARYSSGATLARICRGYGQALAAERPPDAPRERWVRWGTTDDGMVRLDARLHPDEAAVVRKALEAARSLAGRDRWTPVVAGSPGAQAPAGVARLDPGARACDDEEVELPGARAGDEAEVGPSGATVSAPRADHAPAGAGAAAGVEAGGAGAAPGAADPGADPGRVTVEEAERRAGLGWVDGWADALVSVAEAFLADRAADRTRVVPGRFEVALHVGPRELGVVGGGDLEDGTCVSREAARRLACDAPHVKVEHGLDGEVVDVGRRTRRVSAALRRALQVRDRGCRFPSCENRQFVDGHHVQHWADGGATELGNLVLLCRRHHRLVHEGGFCMRLEARGPVFFDPAGRRIVDAPAPPQPPDDPVGWLLERGEAASAGASGAGDGGRVTALRARGDSRGDRQLAVQLLLERRRAG